MTDPRPPVIYDATLVGGAIAGVGVDVVGVARFDQALRRTPGLADRLFTAAERQTPSGGARSAASLAARFAAKEAVAKALGVPRGMDWLDCTIEVSAGGQPAVRMTGTVAAAAAARGVTRFELSLTHDAGIAAAIVLALAGPS